MAIELLVEFKKLGHNRDEPVLIVGGGAALRFSGIDFGSPAASARPDEDLLIREALYLCAGDEVRYHR